MNQNPLRLTFSPHAREDESECRKRHQDKLHGLVGDEEEVTFDDKQQPAWTNHQK